MNLTNATTLLDTLEETPEDVSLYHGELERLIALNIPSSRVS